MIADAYESYRRMGNNRARAGHYAFATTDDGTDVLITVKGSTWSIRIQKIWLTIKTDAAQTITFEDTAASPIFIEKSDASPGANTQYIWEFGPKGKLLTQNKDFAMTFSAAGLAGHVEWMGYEEQTG